MTLLLGAALVLALLHWKDWKGQNEGLKEANPLEGLLMTGIFVPLVAAAVGAVIYVGATRWYPALVSGPSRLAALTISGPARVIDGDTVVVAGTRVRLKGVDAAELETTRGENARRVMVTLVTESLTCRLTGEKTYDREVGYCTTADGTDINRAIIAKGAALACPRYDDRYVPFEQAAALAAQPRSSYCVKRL
jgi:endonuclease YncB( thermonuclease family)